MTAAEASALLVETIRELRTARQERDSWRIVALVAIHQAAELQRDVDMLDARSYVQRRQADDRRDVWLDQTDIRRAAHAA